MSALTTQQIKDSYQGLLKTSDNAALPASGVSNVEDGLGNTSALSLGQAEVQLTNATIYNGASSSIAPDLINDQTVYGGTHDFSGATVTGLPAGTSGTSGTSGGGGAVATQFSSIKTPSVISGGLSFYKLNIPVVTFATSTGYVLTEGTIRYIPVHCLVPGEIINDVAVFVSTAVASSSIALGLYSCSADSNGNFYASTLVKDFGTVDPATTGRKSITGVNFTIPASENNTYYIGILQVGGATSAAISGPANNVSLCYYGALDGTTMNRSMSVTGASGQSTLPTTIDSSTWAGYTSATVYGLVGFK